MLDCQQASQLISKSLDRPLSWRERVEVRFHLFICQYCKRFSQQLITIRKAINRMAQSVENNQDIHLPSDTKNRIAKAIESTADQNAYKTRSAASHMLSLNSMSYLIF